MDEVEVQVVEAQVCQRALQGRAHVFRTVIGIPQLGSYPQVFAPAQSCRQGAGNARAGGCFIAIVRRAVEVAVAAGDSIVDRGRGLSRVDPHLGE